MHVLGANGHAKVVVDVLLENGEQIVGIWDDNSAIQTLNGLLVKGSISDFEQLKLEHFIIAIGNNLIRKKIAQKLISTQRLVIHPRANVSSQTIIGKGSVIIAGATINIDAMIGEHVIINTNASVGHDCIIGNFAHIAPNAALAGNVSVGEGTHVGMGASVIQGTKIGKWCVIGAGAVVINDVPDGTTVVGNPARVIKKRGVDIKQELFMKS